MDSTKRNRPSHSVSPVKPRLTNPPAFPQALNLMPSQYAPQSLLQVQPSFQKSNSLTYQPSTPSQPHQIQLQIPQQMHQHQQPQHQTQHQHQQPQHQPQHHPQQPQHQHKQAQPQHQPQTQQNYQQQSQQNYPQNIVNQFPSQQTHEPRKSSFESFPQQPLELKARDSMGINHKIKEEDQTKRSRIKAQMQRLGTDLDNISIQYNEAFDKMEILQKEKKGEETERNKKTQALEQQLKELKKTLEQKNQQIEQQQNKINSLQEVDEVGRLKEELASLNAQINQHSSKDYAQKLQQASNQLVYQQDVNQKFIEDTINFERDINQEKEKHKDKEAYLESLLAQLASLKAQEGASSPESALLKQEQALQQKLQEIQELSRQVGQHMLRGEGESLSKENRESLSKENQSMSTQLQQTLSVNALLDKCLQQNRDKFARVGGVLAGLQSRIEPKNERLKCPAPGTTHLQNVGLSKSHSQDKPKNNDLMTQDYLTNLRIA